MAIAKDKNISEDMKKVKELLKTVPQERQPVANSLYTELVFMQNTLEFLRKQIETEGPTSMFKQGAQEFLREHPALKGYNTTIQRYSLIYKQLLDMLPPVEDTQSDALMDFIEGR